jgi:hypothetical protein
MHRVNNSAFRAAMYLAIIAGGLFVTADANATKNITVISQSSAKKLCGRAWDGHGCILVGKSHDHAINCYNGTCHNVHVPPPTRTVQPGRSSINLVGGSKQTGSGTHSVTIGRRR